MLFGVLELIPLVLLGLIVLAVANAGSARQDPDPTGRRPYAIYLVSVTFIAVFVLLFATTALVTALVQIPLSDEVSRSAVGVTVAPTVESGSETITAPPAEGVSPSGQVPRQRPLTELTDADRNHVREAIQAGLVALLAGLVLLFHARRLRELVNEPGFAEGPARRAYQAYLYSVCLVSVLIFLVAGAVAAFALVRIIAPGTTGVETPSGLERDEGIRQFITSAFLAVAASGIFIFHWRRTAAFRPQPTAPPVERNREA